jgi:hypothetical protein
MKRILVLALMFGVVSAAVLTAQSKPAVSSEDAVLQLDHALVTALEKGDTATINKLLDGDFGGWVDTDGIMWAKVDVLRAGLKPLVPVAADVKYTEHKYGKVVWIQDNQGNKYAAHFWVQRPTGWKLLHINEISARPAQPGENGIRPDFDVPCVNPCKEVPYKPISASEKAALENWQDQESGNGHHDMHMGDQEVTIGSNTMNPRKSATATGPTPVNRRPGQPVVGTAPVLYARTWDFGDSVVAVELQPTWGGKAYWSSRVFANHGNGFWKMEESYHTTIQAAPPMTAVNPAKAKSTN